MYIKLFTSVALCISLLSSAKADITTLNDAINKAGKQRMLSQKMMKNYSMVGMSMKFNNPSKQLQESITLFDKTLEELIVFIKDKPASEALVEVQTLWIPLKAELEATPDKSKAKELFASVEKLLTAANKATNLITATSKESTGEIINISGKQRMLSQRLGNLYMLKVWNIGMDDSKLQEAIVEFSKAQEKLVSFPKNSDEIKRGLAQVKKDFMFFEILGASKSKKYIPSLIARSSNKITKKMNDITKLYVDVK